MKANAQPPSALPADQLSAGRSDRTLRHQLRRTLKRVVGRHASRMQCIVRDGDVLLKGHVGRARHRSELLKSLRGLDGIGRIQNRLKLRIGGR